MKAGVTLRTERLTLRPPRPDDVAWIACEIAHPELHRWLTSVPRPYRLADAEDWIAAGQDRPGRFVIECDDAPLGVVTLESPAWGRELGYWLARRAWGQGVMTEAAGAVLADHFAQSAEAVPSGHVLGNAGSRRVLQKLGFRDTECLPRHSAFHDREVTVQRMALSRTAWETLHAN